MMTEILSVEMGVKAIDYLLQLRMSEMVVAQQVPIPELIVHPDIIKITQQILLYE